MLGLWIKSIKMWKTIEQFSRGIVRYAVECGSNLGLSSVNEIHLWLNCSHQRC